MKWGVNYKVLTPQFISPQVYGLHPQTDGVGGGITQNLAHMVEQYQDCSSCKPKVLYCYYYYYYYYYYY